MKKRLTTLKWVGLTLAGVVASGSVMANQHQEHRHHHSAPVESHGGLKIVNPEDHSYWFSIGGRLNFDEAQFSGNTVSKGPNYPSGANIRRAFLGFMGGVGEMISYNITLDFSGANGVYGTNGTTVDFEEAYVNLAAPESHLMGHANLRFGQFTPPSSLEFLGNVGTKNDTMFLESALDTGTFSTPQKVYGVWADASAMDMFVLSASAYQPRQKNSTNSSSNVGGLNNNNYGDQGRADRLGSAARLTFAPVHTHDTVYHLGVMGRYQSMVSGVAGASVTQNGLFSTGPEARARNTAMLVTTGYGAVGNAIRAKSYNVLTAEALALWGPVTVSGEYNQANVQQAATSTLANSGSNPRFHGWHAQASYMLTGESRRYDFHQGALHNPKPAGKCGAWEIAARYSFVNLVDKNIYGGSEHNTTLGLNWFANENVRVTLNYIRANIRPTAMVSVLPDINTAGIQTKRTLDIVGLRFGVSF